MADDRLHVMMDENVPPLQPDLRRRVRRLEIRAKRLVTERLFGQYGSVFRGRGLEFSEVRQYLPGDDIRIIDWNVTARMGVPYVKKFVEERDLTVLIAVDLSGSQHFGTATSTKAELAVELSALLAFAAVASNDLVGLLTFTEKIETFVSPAKGPRHALRIIRELLGASPTGRGTDIAVAVNYLQRALRRRAIVFLISDFLDQGYESTLRYAARRHDVIALALSDQREAALVPAGVIEVEDAETGERTWIDSSDASVRRRFDGQASADAQERQRTLSSLGLDVVPISTHENYIVPLTAYLRARAKRH